MESRPTSALSGSLQTFDGTIGDARMLLGSSCWQYRHKRQLKEASTLILYRIPTIQVALPQSLDTRRTCGEERQLDKSAKESGRTPCMSHLEEWRVRYEILLDCLVSWIGARRGL